MKKLVGKAKSKFYVKKIEDCEGDQRKLYSVIDGLMGRNKPTCLPFATSNHILAGTLKLHLEKFKLNLQPSCN